MNASRACTHRPGSALSVALAVPVATLLVAALVLACPVMMIFRMHRVHGMHDGANKITEDDQRTTTDRR